MSFKTDLEMAYLIGYDDATARRKPDSRRALVLDSSNCTNSEQTSDERGTCHMVYNDLSNLSRCTACGWRMVGVPMYYCPRCGRKVVEDGD